VDLPEPKAFAVLFSKPIAKKNPHFKPSPFSLVALLITFGNDLGRREAFNLESLTFFANFLNSVCMITSLVISV
jgi:hypothetical protein